jgi:hypothetical protein
MFTKKAPMLKKYTLSLWIICCLNAANSLADVPASSLNGKLFFPLHSQKNDSSLTQPPAKFLPLDEVRVFKLAQPAITNESPTEAPQPPTSKNLSSLEMSQEDAQQILSLYGAIF